MRKTIKPDYVVDICDIEYLDEIEVTFALGKHNAHLPLTDKELLSIIDFATGLVRPIFYINMGAACICNHKEQKKPWYKRLLNWLRGK